MQKKHRKQSNSTAPALTHPYECLGHHPPNHSGGGVGRKRRGEGSCRWDHGIQPGRQPAFPFLLVRLGLPGGCRGQAAAVSPPGPVLDPLHAPAEPGGSCSWTARTCLEKPKGQLGLFAELHSSGPAAQVALQNSGLKLHPFVQGCKPHFAARAEHLAPRSWVAEAI